MELKKIVSEEFLTGVKGYTHPDKYVEIYVNPNESDFESARGDDRHKTNQIRFIADGKAKRVLIFSVEEIHHTILKELHIGSDYFEAFNPKNRILLGSAIKRGNSWFMAGSDSLQSIINSMRKEIAEQWEKDYAYMVFAEDWSWVNKWIKIDKEMSDLKKEYDLAERIKEMTFLSAAVKNILLKEKF